MRWRWILGAAAAGGALLAWLIPRYETGATLWRLALSRDEALAKAIEVARQNGDDIRAWHFSVSAALSPQRVAIQKMPGSAGADTFTPVTVTVRALAPEAGRTVTVNLEATGRLQRYTVRGPSVALQGPPAEEAAERMFRRLAADRAADYQRVSQGATATGGALFNWEHTPSGFPGFRSRIKVETSHGRVVGASREADLEPELARSAGQPSHTPGALLASLTNIISTLAIGTACWIFFSRLGRRTRHARMAAGVALASAGLFAVTFLTGNRTDVIVASAIEGNLGFGPMLLNVLFGAVMIVLLWLIVFGAGFALLPAPLRSMWLGAGALARREWSSRRIGQELLAGLMLGLPLACVPYLLPASGLFPKVMAEFVPPGRLMMRAPWASSLAELLFSFDALGLVVLLLPLAARFLARPWQWRTAAVLVMVLFTAGMRHDYWSSDPPRLLEAVLLGMAYLLIARAAGVLGLGAAVLAAYAIAQGSLFLAQPSPQLVSAGQQTFVRLGIVGLAAALLAWKGKPQDEAATLEQLDPASEDALRTEHERLLGEFSVARKAQEGMLPEHPPEVPGYELVALCRPALEVGGDLYDFQQLPDGRLLFCVADVSGKGVTASLYMTLTKGLLSALTRHYTHASEIVTEMNRHLYAEGRRKIFVTMIMGVLDPATGALELVRAGHNPGILRRASTNETHDLQPRGLGLGLTGSGSFRAQLDTHKVRLEPGDCLICYSDGLPETMNPVQDQYGEERVRRVAAQTAGGTAAELKDALLESVDRFRSGAEAHDDLTLLIVRALPA